MIAPNLSRDYPLISDQIDRSELGVLLRELERLLERGVRGAVVEFGCYVGTTSLFIRRMLDAYQAEVPFHVYDSFEGLPVKSRLDESVAGDQFVAGALTASRKQLSQNFKRANIRPPIIHKGWFDELTAQDVPDGIMFAFLDGDYFQSIHDSLRLIAPKLLPGAVIIVDDYASEALPGAARAVDDWIASSHKGFLRVESSLALIRLP